VDHVVNGVAGADVGVVDADVGLEMGSEFLVKVAGHVAAVRVRAGAHAGVYQDDVFLRLEEEDAVVELELSVFEGVLIIRPSVRGDVGEHCGRFARRRNHVDNGGYFNIANGCFV
jgi:hypothetical protein